jgi:hypothetical protein
VRLEVVANLGAFLSRADVGKQLLADRVLVGLLGVAYGFKGFEVALARLVQHLAPHVVVGGIKLAVEADGRGAGCTVDAVSQVVAVQGLLATGLEYANTCNEQLQQLGQLLLGGALPALHGALGVTAFLSGRTPLLLQRGACGFQRHDGVGQLGLVLGRRKAKSVGLSELLALASAMTDFSSVCQPS